MALQSSELNFGLFLTLQSFPGTTRLSKNVYLGVEALAGSFDFEVRAR